MIETPGHLNNKPLLDECDEALIEHCHLPRRVAVAAVINVLRRRGILNDAGVALCRAELGPLSVAVIKENSK